MLILLVNACASCHFEQNKHRRGNVSLIILEYKIVQSPTSRNLSTLPISAVNIYVYSNLSIHGYKKILPVQVITIDRRSKNPCSMI